MLAPSPPVPPPLPAFLLGSNPNLTISNAVWAGTCDSVLGQVGRAIFNSFSPLHAFAGNFPSGAWVGCLLSYITYVLLLL